MVFLPILVFAAAAAAAPKAAPTPAPLKVIIHLHTTALCNDLHQVIMPFVVTERKNNIRFVTMDNELGKYHQWYRPPGDDATDPNGDPEFNGGQAIAAAHIDQLAALMYADITHIERLLKASERATPPGKDPQLDALRDRARTITELQRELANRYEAQAGTYLNSLGSFVPMPTAQSPAGDPALQSEFTIPELQPDPLAAAQVPTVISSLATPPPGSQYGATDPSATPSRVVVSNMVSQEDAFVRPALNAVRQCDGQ